MFINYFKDDIRSSPVNLAVGRFILGFWLIWKTIWYEWAQFVDTPYRAVGVPAYEWAIPVSVPWVLPIEKWLLIILLCVFVVGYRIRLTAGTSSVILAHLATVRRTLVTSGETGTLFIGVMVLLFYALYAEFDDLSIDGVRRTADRSAHSIAEWLKSADERQYRMPQLKYSLLLLAILYSSSGLSKVIAGGGLGFAAPDYLTRLFLIHSYIHPWLELRLIVTRYPILAVAGGIGTLVLEFGVLFAVLTGIAFTPILLGLIIFVFSNVVLLGIFFVDVLFVVALFAAYDRAFGRIARERSMDLVFDEHCHFCVRSLYLFKLLDLNGNVRFYSQYDVPEEYRVREDVDFDRAMYAFHGPESYEGYYAFRELLRQSRIFFPLVVLMGLSPVQTIGERVYRYIADNRGRYFTCRTGSED